jgi:hypothetical protein
VQIPLIKGIATVAQGKLQEGLEDHQQSLSIRRTLAEQDNSNSGLQRNLSVSYIKVGDVLVAQGKLQEALEAYQQDLATPRLSPPMSASRVLPRHGTPCAPSSATWIASRSSTHSMSWRRDRAGASIGFDATVKWWKPSPKVMK